jgi:hypothetical protein
MVPYGLYHMKKLSARIESALLYYLSVLTTYAASEACQVATLGDFMSGYTK